MTAFTDEIDARRPCRVRRDEVVEFTDRTGRPRLARLADLSLLDLGFLKAVADAQAEAEMALAVGEMGPEAEANSDDL